MDPAIDPRQRIRAFRDATWRVIEEAEGLRDNLGDRHEWYGDIDALIGRLYVAIKYLNQDALLEDASARGDV